MQQKRVHAAGGVRCILVRTSRGRKAENIFWILASVKNKKLQVGLSERIATKNEDIGAKNEHNLPKTRYHNNVCIYIIK